MPASSKRFTEDQLRQIEKKLSKETNLAKDCLANCFEPPRESPFKSIQQQFDEQEAHIEQLMLFAHQNNEKAVELFLNECLLEERTNIEKIFLKIAASKLGEFTKLFDKQQVTLQDCQYLEEIAKRKLIDHEYFKGSCMFRFIIQLNGFYSEAWVGWALCEQELGNLEAVALIYQMALDFMPYDYYILLFAADFYISINQKEKAKTILEKGKQQLISDHQERSHSFRTIQELLRTVA